MNNKIANTIDTGKVSTQANPIFLSVLLFRFFRPPEATIAPAIPLDNTCVVLTGRPKAVLNPIVEAATISEVAPWA